MELSSSFNLFCKKISDTKMDYVLNSPNLNDYIRPNNRIKLSNLNLKATSKFIQESFIAIS